MGFRKSGATICVNPKYCGFYQKGTHEKDPDIVETALTNLDSMAGMAAAPRTTLLAVFEWEVHVYGAVKNQISGIREYSTDLLG